MTNGEPAFDGQAQKPPMVSYAQNGEDVVLARGLTASIGFYVDVGAHDPTEDSVTRHFYDRGWVGINIDPRDESMESFRVMRPRDVNLCVAVSDHDGELRLYRPPNDLAGHATVEAGIANSHREDGIAVSESVVPCLTLGSILDRHVPPGQAIDFLKVDVEGHEAAVLGSNDWSRWRPRVVVVECLAPYQDGSSHSEWEPGLLDEGYSMVLFDGLNRWYVHASEPELMRLISAPANILDRFQPFHLVRLTDYCTTLEGQLAASDQWAKSLAEEVHRLEEVFAASDQWARGLSDRVLELERRLADASDGHSSPAT